MDLYPIQTPIIALLNKKQENTNNENNNKGLHAIFHERVIQ